MAIDTKYGKVHVPGIPDDEPIFIIRGQDKAATAAVLRYAEMAHMAGANWTHVAHAFDAAGKLNAWPHKKVPDTKPPERP